MKSPASDEPPHLASGLSYVTTGSFRGNPQHPPLLKELSGLSLLLGGIRWPQNPDTDRFLHGVRPRGAQPEWDIGNKLIAGNGPDRVLFWARLPFLLIASGLGVLIYVWGRELLGGPAALGAVFLYVTDPTILGQSFTVAMDVGLAAFTVLFLFALWRYLGNRTLLRLVWCGVALGLVLCVKFSAVLLLPVAAFLVFAAVLWPAATGEGHTSRVLPLAQAQRKAGRNDPCPCGSGLKYKACHGDPARGTLAGSPLAKKWTSYAAALLAIGAIAVVIIEAVYFFPRDPLLYIRGLTLVNADHRPNYPAYLAGDLQHRFPTYFALAYLLKEPLAGLILAAAGLYVLLRRKSIPPLRKMFLLAPPLAVFVATTMLADQIGVRYIMPVLPFAHLLGGLGLATLWNMPAKWGRLAAAGLGAWLVVATLGIYPDHLSYFNESACLLQEPGKIGWDGGSQCGILWLDDSNVDWGQGLKQMKAWLDAHAPGQTIQYMSDSAFPPSIYGIPFEKANVTELATQPGPGLYVVSATNVARVPAINGASDWLRRFPSRVVGHALYVYDVPRNR